MRSLCISALLIVAATALVLAQGSTGAIGGVVTSSDGPVAGVTVQAKQRATGKVFTASTTKSGEYKVAGLPEGAYDIYIPMIGLATNPFTKENVVVKGSETTTVDVTLRKGNQAVLGDDNAYLAIRAKYADVRGPAPRASDGHPDLSGMWNVNVDPNPGPVSMLPWAERVVSERRANNMRDTPAAFCLPEEPMPTFPLFRKIVQTKTLIVELLEQEPHYRQIFLDGRAHPKDADPTWMGHSVGKWEKDTLVVDSAGFNDKSWILFPLGLPHTEMMHVVERYRRPDLARLLVDVTIEDPGTFTAPIERHMTWQLAPGEEILEAICTENNKFEANAGLK